MCLLIQCVLPALADLVLVWMLQFKISGSNCSRIYPMWAWTNNQNNACYYYYFPYEALLKMIQMKELPSRPRLLFRWTHIYIWDDQAMDRQILCNYINFVLLTPRYCQLNICCYKHLKMRLYFAIHHFLHFGLIKSKHLKTEALETCDCHWLIKKVIDRLIN